MVSLIVATVNRVAELECLLASLDAQSFKDFEVLVVDQNPDDRLMPILRRHEALRIRRLVSERGLSRARNVGLREVQGDIVAFPDDDCWYPDQLLATVTEWFEKHPEFDVLFAGARDGDNKLMAPKWAPGPCRCTKENVWHCTVSFTAFMRLRVVQAVGCFNEHIGTGSASKYQSAEDSDYFIRLLELGFRTWYDPSLTVYHPNFQSVERLRRTVRGYALGVGYVLRIHRYSWWFLCKILARSLGGAVISLCKGDWPRTYTYILRTVGQLQGYIFGPRDIGKLAKSSIPTTAGTA
jgi:glycosyltransferase involved in cell wall biosynthesis